MRIFDVAGEVVLAAGKRRAAIMSCHHCAHPDVLEFIELKSGPQRDKFTNMNLSVLVTDSFMHAVEHDSMWKLSWEGRVWSTSRTTS